VNLPLDFFCSVQAHIEQWIDFSTTEIDVNIGKWLYPRLGFYQYVAAVGVAVLGYSCFLDRKCGFKLIFILTE
jgi:hypothetical protein